MLLKTAAAVLIILIGFIVLAVMQPKDFSIKRSIAINSQAEQIFAHINDFHNWASWSPWEKRDLEMEKSFSGATSGKGAIYSWNGNREVGEGRMTIIESTPHSFIRIKLEFFRPFTAINITEFSFKNEAKTTTVTWSMTGEKNLMSKFFGLFMDMDKIIGSDFEKGLTDLKIISEKYSLQP